MIDQEGIQEFRRATYLLSGLAKAHGDSRIILDVPHQYAEEMKSSIITKFGPERIAEERHGYSIVFSGVPWMVIPQPII